MKTHYRNTTLKRLLTTTTVLSFIAVQLVLADEEWVVVIERTPLKTEVTKSFADGYTVPAPYRVYFIEFPEIKENNVVISYHQGRAYYINSNDWTIIRAVDLDTSIKQKKQDSVFVEGYLIPEKHRNNFVEVPNPKKNHSVRYYNNTAYYTDSDFRIVRTVNLTH